VLTELRIQGLGVIADAAVTLGPGLTVVTGETGAGKTMVITGLQLLFGGRGDSSRVRPGTDRAWVEGRLRLDGGAAVDRAVEAGAEIDEDGSLLLARSVAADGRSRAYVGGRSVPLGVLAELATDVLAIHGQADQTRLLRPAEQRAALDRYAGAALAQVLARYAAAYDDWQSTEADLLERTTNARALIDEADRLRGGVEQIDALDPQPGEDVALAEETSRLENAEVLQGSARQAHAVLAGDPGGDETDVAALLGAARATLRIASEHDPTLAELAGRLAEAEYLLTDVAGDLASYAERVESDPARLAAVHERRAALGALLRRYADTLDGLLVWRDQSSRRLLQLDLSDEAIQVLTQRRDDVRRRAGEAAGDLSAARQEAAHRFAAAVTAELAALAMPAALVTARLRPRPVVAGQPVLVVDGEPRGAGPEGCDDVDVLLAAHAGGPPLPLQRGASGGELSRVMLAVEVVFAGTDRLPLLVFDEVDAGVGGRAAVEVGRRLARLARGHQVLVVTHLPQVAAYADCHLVVDKSAQDGVTDSAVRRLEAGARTAELARMLAGQEDSQHARRHAAELLEQAAREALGPAEAVPGCP